MIELQRTVPSNDEEVRRKEEYLRLALTLHNLYRRPMSAQKAETRRLYFHPHIVEFQSYDAITTLFRAPSRHSSR